MPSTAKAKPGRSAAPNCGRNRRPSATRAARNREHSGSLIALGNRQKGFQAAFLLDDSIKSNAACHARHARQQGLRHHYFSGDRAAAVQNLAAELALDAHRAEATPEDKLAYVETLQRQGRKVLMVGDGINDAPVLARADVSVERRRAARWHAKAPMWCCSTMTWPCCRAFSSKRSTRRIIRQNLIWASIYNLIAVPLAVLASSPLDRRPRRISSLIVVANGTKIIEKTGGLNGYQ